MLVNRVLCAFGLKRAIRTLHTIYSVSSGQGKCGVSVLRVSGPNALLAVQSLMKPVPDSSFPQHRKTYVRKLYHPISRELIDQGLFIWFKGPRSFTGEDCCEFHVHGGPAVVTCMLDALKHVGSFRHAEAGEYTKRAFQNGKLDLTEVEGLGDLIHSETEQQRRQAVRQMSGNLSSLYSEWRQKLLVIIQSVANVEAYIDFSEDNSIEDDLVATVRRDVAQLYDVIRSHLADRRRGERLRNGVHIAIVGKPNAGKSSLLNNLSQRDVAITSSIPGTTRDLIEASLNLGGYPVVVTDTAGLRVTEDIVEKEGVRRAVERSRDADVIVLMVDAQEIGEHDVITKESLLSFYRSFAHNIESIDNELIIAVNKVDLVPELAKASTGSDVFPISCTTSQGLTDLVNHLTELAARCCGNPSAESPSLTQARHRSLLEDTLDSLQQFLDEFRDDVTETENSELAVDVVLCAEYLRYALRSLGKLTGKITTDEILDVIFRDFCIGK